MSNRPVRPAPAGPRLRPVLGLLGLGLLLLIALPFLARPGAAPAPAGTPPPTLAPPPTAGRATATPPGEIPPPLPDPTAVATLPPVATRALVPTGATPTAAPGGPTVPAAPTAADSAFSPAATLAALQQAPVPARDLYTLTRAVKLRTTAALPRTLDLAPRTYRLGDTEVFAVGDTANGSYYTITATLREITPHAYWWVAAGNDIDLAALQQSAGRFESRIYPSDRATFGEPPDPGVDNDSHINVLNTAISGALGYFSAADMYTRAVNPFSNQRKMIYAGAAPGGGVYEGLLAHEFQHMIHWNVHPNQNIWLNEGMAELAMKVAGYDTGGPESIFESNPDVQLNDWASPPNAALPHYGAAYLFMNYLYSQYGPPIIRAMMQAPGGDTDAVDQALATLGRPERFPAVFTDWALANWLDKTSRDPRYRYAHLQIQVPPRTTLASLPASYTGSVHQQAADYLALGGSRAPGTLTITFDGDRIVPLIPTRPHSGRALWWSNRDDVSASSLTRAVDLRTVPHATLSYWTWYDIEEGYDYAYAEASTDGGQTWATLAAPGTTAANPNGNNLGAGYTGRSGGGATPVWVPEQVDLSAYAGQTLLLRFQYVTDDGLNLQGFAIDDLRIPEIGYSDDAEAPGPNGWTAQGFVHVDPALPESWSVVLVSTAADGSPQVTPLTLDAANHGELLVDAASLGDHAVLLVAPLAPATTQLGHYRVTIH